MPTETVNIQELYEFVVGSETYRFTSAAQEIEYNSNLYLPRALKSSAVSSSAEAARNSLTITAKSDFEIAEIYRSSPPATVVLARLFRYNEQNSATANLIWPGRVISCDWESGEEEDYAIFSCEPISVSLNRNGLHRRFSKQCPYALYDTRTCKVDRASYEHVTTVVSANGVTLEVESVNALYRYGGGFVEWQTATHIERRFIELDANTTLTLFQPFYGISPGDTVTILPGCPRTISACSTIFNNEVNFGGFPYIKTTNIFVSGLDINPSIVLYQQPSTPNVDVSNFIRAV